MKKKLSLVITKSNFGGAQRYVFDLATSLKDRYDLAVIAGGQGVLLDKLRAENIRIISLPSLDRDISFTKDIKTFFALKAIFRSEKPDIVHLNSSKIGGLGGLAARLTQVPRIVFTGHGWAFNESRPWFQKAVIFCLHIATILLSHVTIAVADKLKRDIGRFPLVGQKLRVVRNGIGSCVFLPRAKAQEMLGLPGLSDDTLVIGTVSELHMNKGLDIALEGFASFSKKHPESHFLIIGEGEQRPILETYIKKHGLASRVILTGFIKDAARYLKAFDIFTLTSRTEALPYVPMEAGQASLPVIATKVGGIPEIIENNISGLLIEPGSSEDFVRVLETLTQPTERHKLGAALKNIITDRFSIERMVKETTEVYEGIR